MTAPVRAGVLRPRVVLSALALLAFFVAILTPEEPGSV